MKTNLLFKRQETVDGVVRVVTRIVPVDIPYINSNEGWILSGHADIIERYDDLQAEPIPAIPCVSPTELEINKVTSSSSDERTESSLAQNVPCIKPGEKFDSPVLGTAKLFRKGDKIGIAYRRGKKTLNQNTKDSVCISDVVKNNFFTEVKRIYGSGTQEYAIYDANSQFEYWNKFIDTEYERQRKICNDKLVAQEKSLKR